MDGQKHPKRKYELKKRADEMSETRRRITEAAVELHGTIGPARTTLSAIAERAGVQRHTVYRHFPADADLFAACSAHYFTANPWPDLDAWREVADPRERLRLALGEMYAYYERNAPMLGNALRDAELVDAVRPTLAPLHAFFADAAEILAAGRPTRGRRRRILTAALHHALGFHTWRSLTADPAIGCAEAVELATALVEAAAANRTPPACRPGRSSP